MKEVAAWNHDALAADLGRWLKAGAEHWVWLNCALGEWGGKRPDIMAYRRYRYNNPVIRAYECKVSRADLLSDLNSEKWRAYLEHCRSVTFIMPSGLCKKEEIPAECGVMFRSGRGWRTERRPQDIGPEATQLAMAKLLTMHPMRVPDGTERSKYQYDDWRRRCGDSFLRDIGQKLSRDAAWYFRKIAEGADPVAEAKGKADEIIAEARELAAKERAALLPVYEALGVDPAKGEWGLTSAIKAAVRRLDADERLADAAKSLREIERSIAAAKRAIEPAARSEAA